MAPELWIRPRDRMLPSHFTAPEQPRLSQVMLPVTLLLPLLRTSPAQSTSPWTRALPEQLRL